MQREVESIDRKNGGSSGEMGDLGVGMSGIHTGREKKKGGRGKEKNEVRDVVTIASKTPNEQRQETYKGFLSPSTPPPYKIPNTKRVYQAKPIHVGTRRTREVKEHGAAYRVTILWTKHRRACARARRTLVDYRRTVHSPVQDLVDIHHHPESY